MWAGSPREVREVNEIGGRRYEVAIDGRILTIGEEKMKNGVIGRAGNAEQLLNCLNWVGYLHDQKIERWGLCNRVLSVSGGGDMKRYQLLGVGLASEEFCS